MWLKPHLAISLRSDFLGYPAAVMTSASHVVRQAVLSQHDPVSRVVTVLRAPVTVSAAKQKDVVKVSPNLISPQNIKKIPSSLLTLIAILLLTI